MLLTAGILLAACSGPIHLGNPLTLPVRGLASALENASYNAQRREVKAWITANEAAMRAERFGGAITAELLATVPPEVREKVRRELREAASFPDFTERATVIVMVHRD